MIIKRMAGFIRQHDWSAVVIEILVVIVGLMLAFQMDRWWEQRGEREQEAEYVARLIADIETDLESIAYAIELASLRKDFADLLMAVAEDPSVAQARPVEFLAAVPQAAFTYSPSLASHTFEDMRSTGNLRLLRNLATKDLLYEYYDFDESQRQFRPLQFMTENQYFELSAGVLSHEQARFIQDQWYVVSPGELDEFEDAAIDQQGLLAAVRRFRSRSEMIDWLPELRGLQIDQMVVNEERLLRANEVLQALHNYAEAAN